MFLRRVGLDKEENRGTRLSSGVRKIGLQKSAANCAGALGLAQAPRASDLE